MSTSVLLDHEWVKEIIILSFEQLYKWVGCYILTKQTQGI